MNRFTLAALLVLQSPLVASAESKLATTFGELLPGFSAADVKARTAAQQTWQGICFRAGAPGNEPVRAEACALMNAKLDAKTPAEARLWLLTQLEHLGREESVDALAALLDDKDEQIREAAVRALTNNPSPQATAKLAKQLATAIGTARIGLLNALGHRGDAAAVDAIGQLLKGDNDSAIAGARALGRTPSPLALKALTAAHGNSKSQVRAAVANALLAHADRLAANKNASDAAAVYNSLNNSDESRGIRLGALRGVIQTSGDKAGELVAQVLSGDDAGAKAVSVGQIEGLSAGAIKSLTAGLDKLPVPSRVQVITALATRGDRSQLPVAVTAAKSSDVDVRRAGLQALGRLGDASIVEFLVLVASGDDSGARVAAESLSRLAADGVDEQLVSLLEKQKTPAVSVALIGVLERRKTMSAIPALLASANATDKTIRAASFNALKTLAAPEHARAMVAAMLKTDKGSEREQAELAVATVCRQIPNAEQRAEPVLAAIKDSNENAKDLMPLLGRIGGQNALKVVREALAESDPHLHNAALYGICVWPDAAANDDLLALAEKAAEPADRLPALLALIRINTARGDRTPEERLAALNVLKKSMSIASRDEDRRAILTGLGNIRHIEALRFVQPYLDQPALERAASRGICDLAHYKPLREPNKAEFEKALDKVIAQCQDKDLVERAKRYKEGR